MTKSPTMKNSFFLRKSLHIESQWGPTPDADDDDVDDHDDDNIDDTDTNDDDDNNDANQ